MDNMKVSDISKEKIDQFIEMSLKGAIDNYQLISRDYRLIHNLKTIAKLCINALEKGNKLIFAGNGGSAADAQHISAEFVARFEKERKSLAAISLASNISTITAISNDYSFDDIYSRQISSIGSKGDIFFAISTSGNSTNILKAIEVAKIKCLKTIGLTGSNKGKMNPFCDHLIEIPNKKTARIQEGHILVGHILCGLIEQNLSKNF